MLPIYFINFPFTHRVTEFLISVRHRSGSWFSASFGANLKSCPLFSAKDSGRNWISGSSMYVSKQLWGQYGVISNCEGFCAWHYSSSKRHETSKMSRERIIQEIASFKMSTDSTTEFCPALKLNWISLLRYAPIMYAKQELKSIWEPTSVHLIASESFRPDCFGLNICSWLWLLCTWYLWPEYLLLIAIVVHLISLARIFALDCFQHPFPVLH